MIAVISDLHFEEEASDVISGNGKQIIFRRNLEPKAYQGFIAHMANEVRRRKAKSFELVIAGDLFDFNRTTLWFQDDARPYTALNETSPELEQKLLGILNATAKEPPVAKTLELFRDLASGKYRSGDPNREGSAVDAFPCPVKITCLAGNHDRVANATPAIRNRIGELIGMPVSQPFPHYRLLDEPDALIRHGHEYDSTNFALDLPGNAPIPLEVDEAGYSQA
ncbi:MAG TPA: hypothetical protein VFU50_20340, partial [Terriglobales bacterium]|nr:hypothetical protein [Terriglobales bacterium]